MQIDGSTKLKQFCTYFGIAALIVFSMETTAMAGAKLSPCEIRFNRLLHDGTKHKAVATNLGIPLVRGRYEGFSCGFSGGASLEKVIKEAKQGCLNESKKFKDLRSCEIVYAK